MNVIVTICTVVVMNFKVRFEFVVCSFECLFLVSQAPLQVYAYPAKHDRNMADEDASNWQNAKASSSMSTFGYGLAFIVIALLLAAFAKFVHEYVFTEAKADVAQKTTKKEKLIKDIPVAKSGLKFPYEFSMQDEDPLISYSFTDTPSAIDSNDFNEQTSCSWIVEEQTTSTVPFSSSNSCFTTSKDDQSCEQNSENSTELDMLLLDSMEVIPKSSGDDDFVICMSNSSVTINRSGVEITSLKKSLARSLVSDKTKTLTADTAKKAKENPISKVILSPFVASFPSDSLHEMQQQQEKAPITMQPQSKGAHLSLQKMLSDLKPTANFQVVMATKSSKSEMSNKQVEMVSNILRSSTSPQKPSSRMPSMYCCDGEKKPVSILRNSLSPTQNNSFESWTRSFLSENESSSSSFNVSGKEKSAFFEEVSFGSFSSKKKPKSVSFSRALSVRFFEKH